MISIPTKTVLANTKRVPDFVLMGWGGYFSVGRSNLKLNANYNGLLNFLIGHLET